MKILVTGGAGFIGSNFILYWLHNHPSDVIVNIDLLTYAGNLENLTAIQDYTNYVFIRGDIRDTDCVNGVMEGIDTVVHFAAESHVDRSISDPQSFITTNVLGTQVLLDAAVKNNIKRFHHISTDEVYGSLELESKQRFTENTPYDPRSPYSASKAGSDHLVAAYYHTYGLPVTLSNCSNNFGPFQHPEKFIPLAITNIIEGKKVPIYGDGKNIRDWLFVEDHCRAIDRILTDGAVGETYCIGGCTEDINNISVVQKIISLLHADSSVVSYIKDRAGHDRRYAIDWKKIHTDLGWKPECSFDTWLEKTVIWYQKNEAWWKHIKSGEYSHYYQSHYGGQP